METYSSPPVRFSYLNARPTVDLHARLDAAKLSLAAAAVVPLDFPTVVAEHASSTFPDCVLSLAAAAPTPRHGLCSMQVVVVH